MAKSKPKTKTKVKVKAPTAKERREARREADELHEITDMVCNTAAELIQTVCPRSVHVPTLFCGSGIQMFCGGMNIMSEYLPPKHAKYMKLRAIEHALSAVQGMGARHGIAVSYRVAEDK